MCAYYSISSTHGGSEPAIMINQRAWNQGEEMWNLGKALQIEMGAFLLGQRSGSVIYVEEYVVPAREKILPLRPEIAKSYPDFIKDAVMGKMESILRFLQTHREIFSALFREKLFTNSSLANLDEEQFLNRDWEAIGLPFVLDLTFHYEKRVKEQAKEKGLHVVGHAHSHTLTTGGKFFFTVEDYVAAEKAREKEHFNERRVQEEITNQLTPSAHELKAIHKSILDLDGGDIKEQPSAQFLYFGAEAHAYRVTTGLSERFAEKPTHDLLDEMTCRISDRRLSEE